MSDFVGLRPEPEDTGEPVDEYLTSITKLTKDLRTAARVLSAREARFLVDAYYAMQRDRIRAGHQIRTLDGSGEPHEVVTWLFNQRDVLETQIRKALDAYSGAQLVGQWARSVTGVGPVIAAGLLANIDITRAPTVGHIWSFSGLNPLVKWEKGTKRPWNGSLKRLCWIVGESFVKVSGLKSDTYGKIYRVRKDQEVRKSDAGDFREQAEASLREKKFGADTEARKHYEQGKLPPARLHLRAERYAVKLFLADLHTVWYWVHYQTLPPFPYVITHLGHADYFGPPHVDVIPGLRAALDARSPVQYRPGG